MAELKLTGNALKGSRPVLSFDAAFDSVPHFQLMKEMLMQVFVCFVVYVGLRLGSLPKLNKTEYCCHHYVHT
jgi:hypothetical protein